MKGIVVRIRKDGTIEAETRGLKGTECLPWIQALEVLTGAHTVDSHYTEEFYESAAEGTGAAELLEQREGTE